MNNILKVENVTKDFDKEKVLKGISLEVAANSFTAILGPSGSGKSTFLNVISGLMKPSSGKVIYENQVISAYKESELADWKRNEVGHIFQNYLLLENLTVEENIRIGIKANGEGFSFDRLVKILELEDLLDKYPTQISGGQQQRVLHLYIVFSFACNSAI